MNSHGRSGIARWVLGSVAEHVVHHATVPLLVLRELAPDEAAPAAAPAAWQGIVALDGSPLAEAALGPAIALLQALASPASAMLRLVRVIQPLSEADDLAPVVGDTSAIHAAHAQIRHEASAYLERITHDLRTQYAGLRVSHLLVESRDPAGALIDTAEQTKLEGHADQGPTSTVVLGMATHGRSGIARWTLGSVTHRVLEGSHVPLLIVRPPAIAAQQSTRDEMQQASSLARTAPLFPPGQHSAKH
jgi:nucleotide-binding universal stress UspA family protein